MVWTPARARTRPSAPPSTDSKTPSVMNWRSSRPRLAPKGVRGVGAGDQEHEGHRSLQDPDRPTSAADDFVLQRLHLQPMPVHRVDVLLHTNPLAPGADERLELVRGSRRRHAVLEAADQIQEVIPAVLAIRRVEAQGQPDL